MCVRVCVLEQVCGWYECRLDWNNKRLREFLRGSVCDFGVGSG